MFNWFKQAAGAVGNLFNQGSRYVGSTFNNADRQRKIWEQQARQSAGQAQRQVQQQVQQVQRQAPKVPQVDFSAVIKQLQALRNQPQVQKIGYATNPINQFKELNKQVVNPLNQFGQNQVNRAMKTLPTLQRANQQALQNPIVKAGLNVPFSNPVSAFNAVSNPRKTFNDTRGAREMFFGKTGELLNTGKSLAPASVVLGVAPYEIAGRALGIKPLENRARQVRNQAFDQYAKQSQTGINPVGSQQQRDIDSGGLKGLGAFARAMGAKGAGAGLEIAPVVTGSAAGVPLKSALLRGGTLGAGGNIGYSAVSGYYSPQRSAQEKAIQLGTDIAGGYGGELLGYGLGRAMGKKGAKTIQDTKGYTGNLIDEMNTKFRQGKIDEKQFRAFVVDDFTKKNGRVPMPADVDAFVDVATGRTNRPYVEAIRQKYAGNQAQLPVGTRIADTAPKPDAQVPVKANRGLIESVKDSPMTKQSLKNALESEEYTVLPNKATMNQAVKTINKNPQAALNEVLSNKPRTAQLNAQGLILAEKAQQRGDFDTAQQIFQAMAPGNTKEGQAIQILSVWGKTKPEGVVKYAQKVVDDANNTLIVAGKNPSITLSADKAANFRKQAEAISKMADGKDKLIATQKMLNEIHQQVPASIAEKAQSLLYYTQLLNPKTAVRNIIGNTGFALGETAKDIVGAPIDIALTGARRLIGQDAKRSIYFPNPIKQVRAGLAGGAEAAKEARFGVNLSGLEGQLQIGNKQPAFRNPVGRGLDKAMQFELSVPDRTFYTSRYQQTLDNLMKGAKVSKPTKEMLDIADYDAKYATFQDDSLAAKAFMNIKKGLNLNKDFGVGSFVINYPKTPGNLLARGIDYSPAGFIKSTLEIAKPIFRQGPFNQKKFIDSFSRALVGTGGLVGTGALLHKAGIITGAPSKDKDVNAQDKATGLGAYRINVDALRRFVTSGFKPQKLEDGDTTLTYDWFQPAAIGISMGANIDETQASDKGAVGKLVKMLGAGGSSIAAGAETLANQPLVQGLTKLTGNGGGITQGMLATLQGVPASFVPTLLNQVNQLTDNTSRSTYDPNPGVQAINMVKAKIPGLASTLQPQVNPEGQNNERYQNGSNNPLNVFLNPAFVGTYNADNVQKEITRLENSTGQTSQYPSIIKNTQKVNGQDVQLSAQQVTDMQRVQGQLTKEAYAKIMSDPAYSRLSDTDKVKKLQNIITQANQIARSRVLSDQNDKDQITVTAEGKKPKVAKAKKPKKGRTAKAKKGRKGRVAKAVKLPSIRLSAPRKVAIAKVAKLRAPKVKYQRLAKSSKTPRIKV